MEQAVRAITTLLGLEDLCPGRHILRDRKRQRTGELVVTKAWYASVAPSFHDRAVIAVACAEDTAFRDKTTPGFLRAGMSIVSLETSALKQAVVADIEFDPLPDAVHAVDILASDETLCLDGIGYELTLRPEPVTQH